MIQKNKPMNERIEFMKDEIKIHVLQCGTVGTDESVPDKGKSKNPYAYTGVLRGKKHRVWIPVFAYVIEHSKGNLLIDTGWHTNVRTDQKKHMTWKLNMASKAILSEGEAITEQLEKIHLNPTDLDYVFLTHMDVDHASGLQLVKDAKCILASKEELQAVKEGDIRYYKGLWEDISMKPVIYEDSGVGPFKRSFDLFGDSSVLLVDLAGHSKGNMGVLISNHEKFVLITGDACYNHTSWQKLTLPGITVNKEKAIKSLEWVKEMSEKPECVEILATHDPAVKQHTIVI